MKNKGNDGKGDVPERDMWKTSGELWNKLNEQYNFMFDCCASKENTKTAEFSDNFEDVKKVYGVAWMNPPFSNARRMFEHFFKVVDKGVAIYRIDNPDTKIWQEVIFPSASWVFIPSGRVSYTPPDITIKSGMTRFPSALIGCNVPEVEGLNGVILKLSKLLKEEE